MVIPDGTYAGVKVSEKTQQTISEFIANNNIPNPLSVDKLHTTLLYSRNYLPNYVPAGIYDQPIVGRAQGFEKWPTNPSNGNVTMCLVLKVDCPELSERHKFLMDEYNATYDFDVYKPHITISYDVGGLQCNTLPPLDCDIEFTEEYSSDLNLNWGKDD